VPIRARRAGRNAEELGGHAFWHGSLWGRNVALQGDVGFEKFDLFEITESKIYYWGTFRGNSYGDSEESHSFTSPFLWLDRHMRVGDVKEQRVSDTVFDPRLRMVRNSGDLTLHTKVVAYHATWQDPDSRKQFSDVLELHYWAEPTSKEVYYLAKDRGTIRFETLNQEEPSGVRCQYVERFEEFTPGDPPALPWFDPFRNATRVPNGFCEDFLRTPVEGGGLGSYLHGWSGTANAVISADPAHEGMGPWKIRLRGSVDGGEPNPAIASTDWIPVTPGRRYRLSGEVWRASAADSAYLDFDDGKGRGENFEDSQANSSRLEAWETVQAEATVGAATEAIKVRCVRDGANQGSACFTGITLQRLD
jgi:hypothetical protein